MGGLDGRILPHDIAPQARRAIMSNRYRWRSGPKVYVSVSRHHSIRQHIWPHDVAEAACRATGRLLNVGVVEDAAHWRRARELPYGVPQPDQRAVMTLASLVLGSASVALSVFALCNVPSGAIGLVLGIPGMCSTSRHGEATAGVILCAIGLVGAAA